jgi:hypothetical protein
MRCRACNSINTRVTSTDRQTKNVTFRYCRCLDCKAHYKTIEKYEIPKPGPEPDSVTLANPFGVGSTNPQSVLLESNVIRLRHMHKKGMNQRQLAKIFGISNQTVSRIVNRKIWTHV